MPTNYEDMTVAELKEEAYKRGISVPHNAVKDELVDLLENGKPAAKSGLFDKENDKKTAKNGGEKRLFQLASGERKELTQAEAEKEGFYWRDEEKLGKA